MKSKFTIIAVLLVAFFPALNAQQQIVNGSFETWTSSFNPDGWITNDGLFQMNLGQTVKDAVDPADGSYSVKLISDTVMGDPTHEIRPSVMSYGTGHYTPGVDMHGPVYNGAAFAFTPDTFNFSYKYSSPSADTASVLVVLYKTGIPVMFYSTNLVPTASWLNYHVALRPFYSDSLTTPDTLKIIFFSSIKDTPVIGGTLNVDKVSFGYKTATGVNNVKADVKVSVYPNPSTGNLNIVGEENLAGNTFEMFDLSGRMVAQQILEGQHNNINVSQLSNGSYVYTIVDKQGAIINRNKVNVIK